MTLRPCFIILIPFPKDRGWDGWMASLTQWTWVWVGSGNWWWTGRTGVLQFMGPQRVGHDWTTELIESIVKTFILPLSKNENKQTIIKWNNLSLIPYQSIILPFICFLTYRAVTTISCTQCFHTHFSTCGHLASFLYVFQKCFPFFHQWLYNPSTLNFHYLDLDDHLFALDTVDLSLYLEIIHWLLSYHKPLVF